MPFKKINTQEEIDKRINTDEELKIEYLQIKKEYELIKQVSEFRKELNVTQKHIAETTGMTQQVVSRMESLGHSPTLRNFIKYIDALGLDIKITKKI